MTHTPKLTTAQRLVLKNLRDGRPASEGFSIGEATGYLQATSKLAKAGLIQDTSVDKDTHHAWRITEAGRKALEQT